MSAQKPDLIQAIIGNSRMLVAMGASAEVSRLFWPDIDYGQNVERFITGVYIAGVTAETSWMDAPAWSHHMEYEKDTNVLLTRSVNRQLGLEARIRDAVWPEGDVFVREFAFHNTGSRPFPLVFVSAQAFWMEESPLYNTVLYEPESACLISYRRAYFFALGGDRLPSGFTCGRGGAAFVDASDGILDGRMVSHGDAESACSWDLGTLEPGREVRFSLFLAAAPDARQARELLAKARHRGSEQILEQTSAFWRAWLDRARRLKGAPAAVDEAYRRSLLVFALVTSSRSGAIIAAPEFDPSCSASGGYAYCWGRDAAYVTLALDMAGYHDLARRFYRWAVRVQEPEGYWVHRHYTGGEWGPSWGLIQIDQTGSLLYGMAQHYTMTRNGGLLAEVWPAASRAAEFLLRFRDPETGLPLHSVDLWEERTAEHTYSAAAVYAGIMGAADLADAMNEPKMAARWREGAADIRRRVLELCWDEGRRVFLRALKPAIGPEEFPALSQAGEEVWFEEQAGYRRYFRRVDPALDASLLALSVPFGLLGANDPRMEATAGAISRQLSSPEVGGIRRYENDQYRGGNPWIICTLWLGLFQAKAGRPDEAGEALSWAIRHQNPVGLLPEQVDRDRGGPAWVLPLTWSHAMFVLLALELYGEKEERHGRAGIKKR